MLLLFTFMVVSLCVSAAQPYRVYCELFVTSAFWNKKLGVSVDFGQEQKFAGNDNRMVDENGEPIYFNSSVDAMNFMGKLGWVFEQTYTIQSEDGTPWQYWLFSCEVTSDDDVVRPLTMSEYKNREKKRR